MMGPEIEFDRVSDSDDGVRVKKGRCHNLTRRQRNLYISIVVVAVFIIAVFAVFVGVDDTSNPDSESWLFPGYHVRPARHWINDPNGPFVITTRDGPKYHLFMQYNPASTVWGKISWAHLVSADMVQWEELGVALKPDESYDEFGVWSGSATIVAGKPVLLYTCASQDGKIQQQCSATQAEDTDVYAVKWVKSSSNPIIANPPPGCPADMFRDPTTAWKDPQGRWCILLGASVTNMTQPYNGTASAALYTSTDFSSWTFQKYLYQSGEQDFMMECPDLFPLPDSSLYALKYSIMRTRRDYVVVGTYDPSTHTFSVVSDSPQLLDPGPLYASKSFLDTQSGRRILWGWLPEEDAPARAAKRGWAGTMSLPRVLRLDPTTNTSVLAAPLADLDQLRQGSLFDSSLSMAPGEFRSLDGVSSMQYEVLATMDTPPPSAGQLCAEFAVLSDDDRQVFVLVSVCRPGSDNSLWTLTVDRSSGNVETPHTSYSSTFHVSEDVISLRVFVDRSVVEAYAQDGRAVVSARVYPNPAQLRLFAALRHTAWNMRVRVFDMGSAKAPPGTV